MNLSDLEQMAIACVDEPIGCGNPFLENLGCPEPYYRFLHDVVRLYKPEIVVECGFSQAFSTVHMAVGNLTSEIIAIDYALNEKAYSIAPLYANMILLEGYTTDEHIFNVVKARCGDKGIGLLFLDSTHDGDTPQRELETYMPLFAEECLVCCDDILLNPQMNGFWSNLPGEKVMVGMLHFPVGFGVSIIRKKADKEL